MSVLKKPVFMAALFSVVVFGLSACGGDDSAGNAEEIRGAVKDVASKAKTSAESAVDHVEDKIKEPSAGTSSE